MYNLTYNGSLVLLEVIALLQSNHFIWKSWNYHSKIYVCLFLDPINMLIEKTNAFMQKFSLKRLKMGSIINLLDKLKMRESKEKMSKVIKTIKVC